jgi:hypothetical protein
MCLFLLSGKKMICRVLTRLMSVCRTNFEKRRFKQSTTEFECLGDAEQEKCTEKGQSREIAGTILLLGNQKSEILSVCFRNSGTPC